MFRPNEEGDAEPVLTIRLGFVCENEAGEQRLVVSVETRGKNPVVIWRTANPNLPTGAKSQGSATEASFRKWAVRSRKATQEDWAAFDDVEQRRTWKKRDGAWIRRFKKNLLKMK